MNQTFQNIKCGKCGASLNVEQGQNSTKCLYCGEVVYIMTNQPPVQPPQQPQYQQPYQQPYQQQNGNQQQQNNEIVGTKSKTAAILLAFFLGGLGIHQFYVGNTAKGVIYLIGGIICTITIFLIWIPWLIAFIDFIIFIAMSQYDFDQKYNRVRR